MMLSVLILKNLIFFLRLLEKDELKINKNAIKYVKLNTYLINFIMFILQLSKDGTEILKVKMSGKA